MTLLPYSEQSKHSVGTLLIRVMVGVVFISEGMQKFLYAGELGSGRFAKIGIPFADVLGPIVGATEVVCGALVLLGLLTRLAALPLLGVMVGALISTKIPILVGHDLLGFSLRPLPRYGFLSMLHEARTDLCMVCGLIYVRMVGAGALSLDARRGN